MDRQLLTRIFFQLLDLRQVNEVTIRASYRYRLRSAYELVARNQVIGAGDSLISMPADVAIKGNYGTSVQKYLFL